MAPRWPPDGPQMAPRWPPEGPQRAPRGPQEGPQMARRIGPAAGNPGRPSNRSGVSQRDPVTQKYRHVASLDFPTFKMQKYWRPPPTPTRDRGA